jgi:sugar phosphate isomerase/epimerase
LSQWRPTAHACWQELADLPCLELEDLLAPGYADVAGERAAAIRAGFASYPGQVLVSGPFIDLNPGSGERLIVQATRQRFEEACAYALAVGASEVVFLSTFIPIVYLSSYEESWVEQSIAFWKSFLESVDPGITVALGNTFEFTPVHLVRIVETVDRPNFRLAMWAFGSIRIDLAAWLAQIGPHCTTVYVHSNDKQADTHDPPYTGALRAEDLAAIARALPPDAKFLAKMNDKSTIAQSVAWIQRAVGPGGQ